MLLNDCAQFGKYSMSLDLLGEASIRMVQPLAESLQQDSSTMQVLIESLL